ncbi:MAG: glucose 1-dehydrogenase [Candidatus Eisenbacteria bacterium]|uniref:Glucose 1-dehydrogenase n=1 Tax=Eiseniibacteriota bacterium TaxID=2212470 RepID=A0A933SCC9_UNCEI|nr:glucose 1-dehydrogenase [Candidatus Eisenbacteria bacterium]
MGERMRFTGKVALVTGASSGIGRATARALGAEGAAVALGGRRRDRLDEVAAELNAKGVKTLMLTGDVKEEATAAAWVKQAVDAFGGLDVLVNAAGVIGNGSVMDTTADNWRHVMASNVDSILWMTRAAAEPLKARKGAIVNVSSVAGGVRPYPGLASYCVSKGAVDMLTRCSALDFAPFGVRVNAIAPGVVVTELHTVTNAVADYPAFLERGKTTHPIGRVGNAEEVATLILYLASDEAGWVTGANVSIDGGRALASAR